MKFTYHNPTLIEFGSNTIAKIATHIPKNSRVLIVYGGGSIKKNGIYEQVIEALKEYSFFEFGGIEPNPTKETLDKALAFAKEKQIDFVLAVGGGSVIDGCKYLINAFYYQGDGWDLLEGKYTSNKALPLGVILTLAATGSESNTGAVITKKQTNEKRFFHSHLSYPKFAILDPNVLKSLDDRQLANGIIDSFVHTCEQYLTVPHKALAQDYYAQGILKALIELIDTYDTKDDLWYANLMWLANQALNGLIGLGVPQDWSTHFIGHELSGLYGIDHARTLAIIQPHLLTVLKPQREAKLLQMGKEVFGLQSNDASDTIEAIKSLYKRLNVDMKLSNYTQDSNLKQKVTSLLEQHGFTVFGVNGEINKQTVEQILDLAQ
jgi:NADP-dependent alcohol dehydrogenase